MMVKCNSNLQNYYLLKRIDFVKNESYLFLAAQPQNIEVKYVVLFPFPCQRFSDNITITKALLGSMWLAEPSSQDTSIRKPSPVFIIARRSRFGPFSLSFIKTKRFNNRHKYRHCRHRDGSGVNEHAQDDVNDLYPDKDNPAIDSQTLHGALYKLLRSDTNKSGGKGSPGSKYPY